MVVVAAAATSAVAAAATGIAPIKVLVNSSMALATMRASTVGIGDPRKVTQYTDVVITCYGKVI